MNSQRDDQGQVEDQNGGEPEPGTEYPRGQATRQLGVDHDDEFEEVTLPEPFTLATLDTDQASAATAGNYLAERANSVLADFHRLEMVERALREAEPHSDRARQARAWIRQVLAVYEDTVLSGLDEARCALVYHWDAPSNGISAQSGPHWV
ncbi:MAG: hypothetical protein ACRDQ5_15205 [Sciscionella sp.]